MLKKSELQGFIDYQLNLLREGLLNKHFPDGQITDEERQELEELLMKC